MEKMLSKAFFEEDRKRGIQQIDEKEELAQPPKNELKEKTRADIQKIQQMSTLKKFGQMSPVISFRQLNSRPITSSQSNETSITSKHEAEANHTSASEGASTKHLKAELETVEKLKQVANESYSKGAKNESTDS